MTSLFFLLSFNNTILDSTKDTLVITAVGGAQQVPFLTLYVVLPISVFVVASFVRLSARFRRETVFNILVLSFMAFFGVFSFFVYPHREVFHLHATADYLESVLPGGFLGFTSVVRQWSYSLYYCMAELWGDVMLSLQFWMLANATTREEDAPLLYPLFGLGANAAQMVAGRLLKYMPTLMVGTTYDAQLQALTGAFLLVGLVTLVAHAWISGIQPIIGTAAPDGSAAGKGGDAVPSPDREKEEPTSFFATVRSLLKNPALAALCVMSVAQGVATNLLEVAWKSELRVLYPQPEAYSAFMGDVASICGLCTAMMMLVSPYLFSIFSWSKMANITPKILISGGTIFFLAAIARVYFGIYNAGTQFALASLGGGMFIFSRAAKFGFFKPSEEMVYLKMDDESRSTGKATVDVIGAQFGKSVSSLMQQILFIISGGSIAKVLPVMLTLFVAMLQRWMSCVKSLAKTMSMDAKADLGGGADDEADGKIYGVS